MAMRRWPVLASFLAVLLAVGCRPSLELYDLDGRTVDPFEGGEPTAFVFVRSDCPIANRYAPELTRLDASFSSKGGRLWLVYPDRMETAATIRAHKEEYSLAMPALRDPQHDLVRRVGASITPEAAVFDAGGTMIYRGRIDDRVPTYGAWRAPTTRELAGAMESALEGRSFEPAVTTAVGCFISDLQ
ncbi:MAG TPA: redoxin domain-containing protein [Vicinamibacteria bacterium]|nr:redoxin domain-containing protein [Vicinamibacteria bacterium]